MPSLRRHAIGLCFAATALVAVSAQRRWIVDAAAGPGHDFTDLPAALAAAQHGDVIELRAGAYRGSTTDRGVTIVGTSARLTTLLRITGLPLGRAFAMAGVAADGEPWWRRPAVECLDNAGRIHFDRVTLRGSPFGNFTGPGLGLSAARCRSVTITGSTLSGGPAASVLASALVAVDSTFTGSAAQSSRMEFFAYAEPGLHLELASAAVYRCRLTGGTAGMHFTRPLPAAPGLRAIDSDVVLAGTANDACLAGAPSGTVPGASAVTAERGTLLVDPSVPLVPTGGLPPIGGTASVSFRRLPALLATGAPIGRSVACDLFAPAGHAVATWIDLVREPIGTGMGALWLDPARMVLVDVGLVGAGEHRTFVLAMPNQPLLAGKLLALQGLALDPARGRLDLGNPAVFVVH